MTEWTLDVGADYQRLSYSNDYYRSLNFSQHDVWAGPSWRPSDKLRLGLDYRLTMARSHTSTRDIFTGQIVPNDFTRRTWTSRAPGCSAGPAPWTGA